MKPLGQLKRHFWLAKQMAKTTGVDLASAREAGDLEQKDWAAMVHRCRSCSDPGRCARWLEDPGREIGAEVPLAFCENKTRFEALKSVKVER